MKKPPPDPVSEPFVIETFLPVGYYERRILAQPEPSCWNGSVRVRKTRVTIQPIDEPREVVAARVQELWEHSDNYHHWEPLRRAADQLGYELIGPPGARAKKETAR